MSNKVNLGKMEPSACKELKGGFINEESNCMVNDKSPPKNIKKTMNLNEVD